MDNLLPQEVQFINNIVQSVQDIRRINLLFEGPYAVESNSDTSEVADCMRSVPVHGLDVSDQESFMSEVSGSE